MKAEGQLWAKNVESKDVEMFAMIALNDCEWWAMTGRDDRGGPRCSYRLGIKDIVDNLRIITRDPWNR